MILPLVFQIFLTLGFGIFGQNYLYKMVDLMKAFDTNLERMREEAQLLTQRMELNDVNLKERVQQLTQRMELNDENLKELHNEIKDTKEELQTMKKSTNEKLDLLLIKAGICTQPSRTIDGLGCVIPVTKRMTYTSAKDNCISKGGRLLEGITNDHRQMLRITFDAVFKFPFSYHDVFMGVHKLKWIESGTNVPRTFWDRGSMDRGDTIKTDEDCAIIALQITQPTFWTENCTKSLPSFCQVF